MPFTRTTFLRIIKVSSAIIVILLVVSYALWRSFSYARGPQITINDPADGSSTQNSTIVIHGNVERANNITLNGKAISIDEQGNFNQTIVIFAGANTITFEAHDQFGRVAHTQINLIGLTK